LNEVQQPGHENMINLYYDVEYPIFNTK